MVTAVLSLLLLGQTGAPPRSYSTATTSANNACDCDNGGGRHNANNRDGFCASDDMPQSCYGPNYGCYPGNDRRTNRYPAFSGSYYAEPYNYRTLFDYPWQADLHEPTSLFSYNVILSVEDTRPAQAPAAQNRSSSSLPRPLPPPNAATSKTPTRAQTR